MIDPSRTALVVIDMVSFFVDDEPYAMGVVPNVNALAGALRAAGGTVAWVVPSEHTVVSDEFFGPEVARRYRSSGGRGQPAGRVAPAMGVADHDLVVEKSSPSAFFPGRCDLATRLRSIGVDTVLVAGTVANVCCESSVRDASTLGYRVVMVADANAAPTDAALNATLTTVYRSFGDVRPTPELLALLAD